MLPVANRHSQRYAIAAASFVVALGWPSWSPRAEPVDDADGVRFEERFLTEVRSAPTFTLPEVAELFTTVEPQQLSATRDSPETTGDAPDRSLGEIVFAEPKGPARVLGKLLNTPVQELLISRAEAGAEVPPPDSGPASPSSPPAADELSPRSPAQNVASVPARNPDPVLERPSGEQVASMPAPDPVADSAASRTTPPPPDAASAQERAEALAAPVLAPPQSSASNEPAASGSLAPNTYEDADPKTKDPKTNDTKTRTAAPAGRPSQALKPPEPGAARTVGQSRRIGGGRAAWYEHPGRTANGERFDPKQLTAAHHTLPFGTRVRVVNEKTGLSVVVRINDRLPRKAKFTIDLSRASARLIGITATTGIGRVALYKVDGPS